MLYESLMFVLYEVKKCLLCFLENIGSEFEIWSYRWRNVKIFNYEIVYINSY